MESLISFIAGISNKVYDDIVDNNIEINDTAKESLKGIQWTTLTVLSINDFNFTLLNYIINILNHFGNPDAYKEPYEFSLLLVYPFLLLLNYHTAESLDLINIFVIIPFLIVMYIEPYFITHDLSSMKLISRILISIGLCITLVLNNHIPFSTSVIKLVIYSLGYAITSSLFQFYMLYIKDKQNADDPSKI